MKNSHSALCALVEGPIVSFVKQMGYPALQLFFYFYLTFVVFFSLSGNFTAKPIHLA